MTPKAREFVEHNTTTAVIAGAWLPAHAAPVEVERIRYRFADGSVRTLTKADVDSMRDANIRPRWVEF